MKNIIEIVEKIKSIFPEIRVIEKVKFNKHYTADYVIIQGLKIKAIFISLKIFPDNICEKLVLQPYEKKTFYFIENKIKIVENSYTVCNLIEVNYSSIFDLFYENLQPINRSIYKTYEIILNKLYQFSKIIDELHGIDNSIKTLEEQLKTQVLIYNDVSEQPFYNKKISWKDYAKRDSLVPTNPNYSGYFYNCEGEFNFRFEIKFLPLDNELSKQDAQKQLEVSFHANGNWKVYKKFRDRSTYNKLAKDSDLPEFYLNLKDSDGLSYSLKKNHDVLLQYFCFESPSISQNLDDLVTKVIDVEKSRIKYG
jgi:hypothetical protein